MPLGDAQRTWSPEMIARLRSEWHEGLSMPALIGLRDELDGMLHRIRAGQNFRTPMVTCHRCGKTGPGAEPHVSVRALILALARFGNLVEGASPCIGKSVGRIPKATVVGHRRKGSGKIPGSLRLLTIPQPIGLRMICRWLRLACNFPIVDSNGTNPSIGRGQA